MWVRFYPAFAVFVIGGAILSIIEVDAQSTVDDSALCEDSTPDEAVNLIRESFKHVRLAREDLKNYMRSNEQHNNTTCISKKDLEELKTACAPDKRQSSTVNTSSLCEYSSKLFTTFSCCDNCCKWPEYDPKQNCADHDHIQVGPQKIGTIFARLNFTKY